jgi:hypothetical protein
METPDITPENPSIPDEPPEHVEGGEAQTDDQPMGVPADADGEERYPLPGIPEKEPPASE